MRFSRIAVVTVLTVVGLALAGPAAAEEQVARIREDSVWWGGMANRCQDIPRCIFVVYTKQEIDAKEAGDTKSIKALQDLVAELQKNVKVLSDANDALTKRLEDAERRLADKQ